MDFASLMQWWNFFFVLVLGVAILVTLISTVVGGFDHDADADHSIEHDFDHGVEHSVGHEHGHEAQESPGTVARAMSVLGVGKVPLSIIMISFLSFWGFLGLVSNLILANVKLPPEIFFWISMVVSLVAAIPLTRLVANSVSRIMPSTETYGATSEDLLGRPGIAIDPITPAFGRAQVRDQYGNLHQVDCRPDEEQEPIPTGTEIVLVSYDGKGVYRATTSEHFEEIIRAPRRG